jgi:hypothetical protein
MDLRNVGILPQHYKASQSRRPRLEGKKPFGKPKHMFVDNINIFIERGCKHVNGFTIG